MKSLVKRYIQGELAVEGETNVGLGYFYHLIMFIGRRQLRQ